MRAVAAQFSVGQLVHHRLFDYRGVIVDVDPRFQGTEEWYQQVAKSRPPRDKPWYHVLVHESGINTYVAERNLEQDDSKAPINHPAVGQFFSEFRDGVYVPRPMN
jgi:heat shock protein HspQ